MYEVTDGVVDGGALMYEVTDGGALMYEVTDGVVDGGTL